MLLYCPVPLFFVLIVIAITDFFYETESSPIVLRGVRVGTQASEREPLLLDPAKKKPLKSSSRSKKKSIQTVVKRLYHLVRYLQELRRTEHRRLVRFIIADEMAFGTTKYPPCPKTQKAKRVGLRPADLSTCPQQYNLSTTPRYVIHLEFYISLTPR